MVKEGTAAHGTGADTSVPPTVPGRGKPSKTPGKESAIRRIVRERWNAISLSTKLVTTLLVLLTIGVAGISFSIRQLVSNYLLEKVDAQIVQQANLVFQNINSFRDSDTNSSGMTSYFLQIRDTDANILTTPLKPTIAEGVVSEPILPASGTMGDVVFGEPFTTSAIVHLSGEIPSRSTLSTARAPWRVVAMRVMQNDNFVNIVFIGLPLGDSIDTISSLTRYCIMVGTAVVLLGGVLGMLVVQGTLAPLKRIEKTAAKIAAGDLKQRIPAMPENTEIGSLSASLNAMLARIERSFHEQQETTDKMKRFVSDASHELRTPLAAIHGYAELYKMQRDMPGALERADESIAHIEASSSRMTVLVEDLLSLARLDEGRGIDITQQVNLTAIVKDAADDLHALDPERGITCGAVGFMPRQGDEPSRLMFELKDLPAITLHGDASRLRQVVTNIVGNIHRYTPADSPVEVSMGEVIASIGGDSLGRMPATEQSLRHFLDAVEVGQSVHVGMRYAVVRFSDHGPGVPAESRARIFERFYTADPSRARQKGGTGLGMAIVESVVKAHHGFICACQTDGGGLTIVVVLPIAPVEIPAMSAPGGKPAKGAKQQKSGKSLFAPKSAKSAKPSKPDKPDRRGVERKP
ncbi:HAMP domain-containing histidine kinase [Bifidobacterium pullorum subsp. saeculare]|uniref:HAMP domain-containing sensor histidine kinase n=1 Tax=Bifidobacterium pullorum TaxID=78448 RepID=UPI00195A7E57|nr:HAMP domain-containing sensor histidine kinase [Bifidobacterium pullorum]MBM6696849.1 HAMP domain-containing histidine kinase [Bifidobacterium pullorum subsp. saeculare]